jgi:hypothetical protein
MAVTHLPTHPLAERLEHRLRHDIFFVLFIPTRLHCLRRSHPPPQKPLPKLAERNLQVIERVLPRFSIVIVVVFCRDDAAVVALLLLPPNEQCAKIVLDQLYCN